MVRNAHDEARSREKLTKMLGEEAFDKKRNDDITQEKKKRKAGWFNSLNFLPKFSVAVALYCVFLSFMLPDFDDSRIFKLASDFMIKNNSAIKVRNNDPGGDKLLMKLPMAGSNVVITGATSGIGKSLAIKCYYMGATVIAIGRSEKKLNGLERELENDFVGTGNLIKINADLTDLDSVSQASNKIKKEVQRIDFLVNNAGIHVNAKLFGSSETLKTKQGFDLVFGVNYLSHFLLTSKLLPLLERSKLKQSRIIQISSTYHWQVDGRDLNAPLSTSSSSSSSAARLPPVASQIGDDVQTFRHKNRSYGNSKLAQIYHMRVLNRILQSNDNKNKSKVRVVSVCPSWVATNIGGFITKNIMDKLGAFPADGAGLSSTMNAMFLEHVGTDETNDYVSQSLLYIGILFPSYLRDFMDRFQIRDNIVHALAWLLVYIQRPIFHKEGIVKSSQDSYNVEYQENLYEWSKEVLSPWL